MHTKLTCIFMLTIMSTITSWCYGKHYYWHNNTRCYIECQLKSVTLKHGFLIVLCFATYKVSFFIRKWVEWNTSEKILNLLFYWKKKNCKINQSKYVQWPSERDHKWIYIPYCKPLYLIAISTMHILL